MQQPEYKDEETTLQNFLINRTSFVISDMEQETTSDLITGLFALVNRMEVARPFSQKYKITSPYNLQNKENIVLDFYIDSKGGDTNVLRQLSGILAFAKTKGMIVRTHVYGTVYSSASILAIQGTKGYRIMGEHAFHFIHHGGAFMNAAKRSEIQKAADHMQLVKQHDRDIYFANTKLNSEQLDELQMDEMGYLDAKSCLKYGLCDWILLNSGKFTNRCH